MGNIAEGCIKDSTWLLSFVRDKMSMSGPYQPLLIAALVRAGGELARDELARVVLINDRRAKKKATSTLMRWPLRTLRRHQIVSYDRKSTNFRLLVQLKQSDIENAILQECDKRVETWRRTYDREASKSYATIARASARCQACGIPGSERALEVDHIAPREKAKSGRVKLQDGTSVPVDDLRNLQVLCTKCNRGKRDTDVQDFRPSAERLAETIAIVLARGKSLGYDLEQLLPHKGT
jgi:5-methylcytosine-specific restriction endonuclease McrA